MNADKDRYQDFVRDYLADRFRALKSQLGDKYPRVFLIMGNDDFRVQEEAIEEVELQGVWEYVAQPTSHVWGLFRVRIRLCPADAVSAQGLGTL